MRTLLLIAAALLPAAETKLPDELWIKCEMASATLCEIQGCRAIAPQISIYLASYEQHGKQDGYYYRCAKDGCAAYEPVVSRSGKYLIFALPNNGLIVRVSPGMAVTDVATLADAVLINRGRCEDSPPPILVSRPRK